MEGPEKRVFRRKRHVLTEKLTLSKNFVRELRELGFVGKGGETLMLSENSANGRMGRFLDGFIYSEENFKQFCDLIHATNEPLAEELRAEYRAELGELEIDESVKKEARILVQREFASVKRLTDAEKDECEDLVATRMQYAKEVWRGRLARAKATLKEELEKNNARERRLKKMNEKVQQFVKFNGEELGGDGFVAALQEQERNKASEKESSQHSDLTLLVLELDDRVEEIIQLTLKTIEEKSRLMTERKRAIELLDKDNPKLKIDVKLKEILNDAELSYNATSSEIENRQHEVTLLEGEIAYLKGYRQKATSEKDEKIKAMTSHLQMSMHHVQNLTENVRDVEAEVRETRNEIKRLKNRAAELEQTRFLGYRENARNS